LFDAGQKTTSGSKCGIEGHSIVQFAVVEWEGNAGVRERTWFKFVFFP
jgi:hypothetical protein